MAGEVLGSLPDRAPTERNSEGREVDRREVVTLQWMSQGEARSRA